MAEPELITLRDWPNGQAIFDRFRQHSRHSPFVKEALAKREKYGDDVRFTEAMWRRLHLAAFKPHRLQDYRNPTNAARKREMTRKRHIDLPALTRIHL